MRLRPLSGRSRRPPDWRDGNGLVEEERKNRGFGRETGFSCDRNLRHVELLPRQLLDLRIERARLELQSLAEQVGEDAEDGEAAVRLVVGRDQVPRRPLDRGL